MQLKKLDTTTGILFMATALSYFFGFKRIEIEAWYWAHFAIGAGSVLLIFAWIHIENLFFNFFKTGCYMLFLAANAPPINIWLKLHPGTDYVIGYLGLTKPLYAWPHFVIILLLIICMIAQWRTFYKNA